MGAKLFLGFFATALPILVLAGLLFEREARRALELELGRRAESMALAIATSIPADTWQLLFSLGPGEEESRIARHLRLRLNRVERATGAERIAVWTLTGDLWLDSRVVLPIGSPAPRAELLREELSQVADGACASTPLFRSERERWVKLGLAPLMPPPRSIDDSMPGGPGTIAPELLGVLVVEAPAESLGVVAAMRRTLVWVCCAGLLLVVLAATLVSRSLTRRIHRLVAAARNMERGDLDSPIPHLAGDEVGILAGALEAMRGAVKVRERHLQAMLGGVAHEIRNPLGSLVLNAEWLARDPALPQPQGERARRILDEATRLEDVVAEFLAYAKPERPVPESVALAGLLRESAQSARDSLRWTGQLDLQIEAEARTAVDPGHLRQILLNLLRNGMQAAGASGRVGLGMVAGEQGLELWVEDSGPGIRTDDRERIFEPFFTTDAQGSGLGLAIVRRLADLGSIEVSVGRSPLGGARFRLRFTMPAEE